MVKNQDAIAGINAGGFDDPNGRGMGNILNDTVIMNKKLVYGNKSTRYSLIGLSQEGKLILGKYNYQEAIEEGIESAIAFGPFIIVNGNNQIKNANAGGLHPRMAIGQKQDGTMIFVAIDGRQPRI
ncbi:MAG: phosphodiester glycosidase family protein [Clostridia bacterium]|nr:phosphodiester glycosidase family protein [Clostridia bacterium]